MTPPFGRPNGPSQTESSVAEYRPSPSAWTFVTRSKAVPGVLVMRAPPGLGRAASRIGLALLVLGRRGASPTAAAPRQMPFSTDATRPGRPPRYIHRSSWCANFGLESQMTTDRPVALVTAASSGIGEAASLAPRAHLSCGPERPSVASSSSAELTTVRPLQNELCLDNA